MCVSLSTRHSEAAAGPAEGRPDRCGGVPHQCGVCQTVGTSGGSGKWRYPSTRPNKRLAMLLYSPTDSCFMIFKLWEDEEIWAAGNNKTGMWSRMRLRSLIMCKAASVSLLQRYCKAYWRIRIYSLTLWFGTLLHGWSGSKGLLILQYVISLTATTKQETNTGSNVVFHHI